MDGIWDTGYLHLNCTVEKILLMGLVNAWPVRQLGGGMGDNHGTPSNEEIISLWMYNVSKMISVS